MNPATGRSVPVEAVLGLNAVRIGNLWQSAGKPNRAEAAYAEARAHYRAALEAVEPDSEDYVSIQRELDAVPAPAGD